jgi:hypothetical protein
MLATALVLEQQTGEWTSELLALAREKTGVPWQPNPARLR